MDNITFIIKTFERFYCIKRLVKSIFKYYPEAVILIADDSAVSCKEYFEKKYPTKNITVYELEHDCGLSYGRNYLLERVTTKYFVLLDDDFVFDKETDIIKAKAALERENVDILGGYLRNYRPVRGLKDRIIVLIQTLLKSGRKYNYIGNFQYNESENEVIAHYYTNRFPEYCKSDIVLNFFVAKTDVVLNKNRWNNELKMQEHTAFFFNAKRNGLKVGFSNVFSVQHKPIIGKSYGTFRYRDYFEIFMKMNGIKRYCSVMNNDKVSIKELEG